MFDFGTVTEDAIVTASNGLVNQIVPPRTVETLILPVTQSRAISRHPIGQDGKRMMVDLPVSSTVPEKSVPLTPIVAVGVSTMTCCGSDFAICPEAYFIVPNAILIPSLPVFFSPSYTNVSITSLDCSVICTFVSSLNVMPVLLFAVVTISFISTSDESELLTEFLSRLISVGPVCSVTLPTSALVVIGLDSNSIARTSNCTIDF